MDDETWVKLLKVVAPGIRKIKVRNIACIFPNLLSIYLTLHLCTSKFSADGFLFTKVVGNSSHMTASSIM